MIKPANANERFISLQELNTIAYLKDDLFNFDYRLICSYVYQKWFPIIIYKHKVNNIHKHVRIYKSSDKRAAGAAYACKFMRMRRH